LTTSCQKTLARKLCKRKYFALERSTPPLEDSRDAKRANGENKAPKLLKKETARGKKSTQAVEAKPPQTSSKLNSLARKSPKQG